LALKKIKITAGLFTFSGELQTQLAPNTCAEFLKLLPYRQKLIQARWSGESAWIPLGSFQLNVGLENAKTHPAPGELLFYPGGISETEILFPYGQTTFACKAGELAGNPFLMITAGRENLTELGRLVLWEGAQDILFEAG
jgi:hypothetical protein